MAEFATERGLRTVAVHSGETSAPRASALKALEAGDLDIVFAVDMFNEGVDVPAIDTVLMLRPTESPVVWLQQLGRGLRKSAEKTHLAVIDYIGNHRSFLTKARTLLQARTGEGALRLALERVASGDAVLPAGCEVTYDLEALDILRALIRRPRDGDELAAFYRDFRERHGTRPTASEVQHAGFNPARTGYDGWFGFVSDMGDLTAAAHAAWQAHRDLLDEIETTRMTRSYKMLVLRAMIEAGAFPGRITLNDLVGRVSRAARRNPEIAADLSVDAGDHTALRRVLLEQPLKILGETRWFRRGPGTFETTMGESAPALTALVSELVDWRLTRYLQDKQNTYVTPPSSQVAPAAEKGADAPTAPAGPTPWTEYPRERIAPLFGATFNTGAWNAGIVVLREARAMILLVTMDKGGLATGNHYADRFDGPRRFVWQTQTSTRRDSERGRIISGRAPDWTIHLFVRKSKLRDGRAAPFRYAGPVTFADWEGEAPITVYFDLAEAVPPALRDLYGIADA
jgi:hypothetical protein